MKLPQTNMFYYTIISDSRNVSGITGSVMVSLLVYGTEVQSH
jgi:hypothetical protein